MLERMTTLRIQILIYSHTMDWQALIMLTQIQSLKIHLNQRTFLSVANGKDIHSPLPQGRLIIQITIVICMILQIIIKLLTLALVSHYQKG